MHGRLAEICFPRCRHLHLQLHHCVSYNVSDFKNTISGPRGTLRFKHELARFENRGLDFAMDQIEDIKQEGNHITALLSYSDLIQLGGYAAVEYCGGPSMIFNMGRKDATEADKSSSSEVAPVDAHLVIVDKL